MKKKRYLRSWQNRKRSYSFTICFTQEKIFVQINRKRTGIGFQLFMQLEVLSYIDQILISAVATSIFLIFIPFPNITVPAVYHLRHGSLEETYYSRYIFLIFFTENQGLILTWKEKSDTHKHLSCSHYIIFCHVKIKDS